MAGNQMAVVANTASAPRGGPVCVASSSGFFGSWLVCRLLDRGYTVHATVQNLHNECETKHLLALGCADTRLRLFQMDLLDPASVRQAVEGARGVFHLAPAMILHAQDPEKELLEPAVKGTLRTGRGENIIIDLSHSATGRGEAQGNGVSIYVRGAQGGGHGRTRTAQGIWCSQPCQANPSSRRSPWPSSGHSLLGGFALFLNIIYYGV